MKKNIIIIVTGDLAAGKTTFGKKISSTLRIPFFSKDDIKEILFDSYNENIDYETKRKVGAKSYDVFYYILEEQMKVGLPIIAESNFVKESIPIIQNLLNKYHYTCITIRFEGDLHVLHKRFLKREYSNERNVALVANGKFDNFEDFEKIAIKSKEFKIDCKEIIVDTTDFSSVNYENLISNIKRHIN